MRSILKDPFPYSVDWRMLGAFNGVVLSDKEHAVQILFFSLSVGYDSPGSISVTLPNMIVNIYVRDNAQLSVSAAELISLVESWWDEFQQYHSVNSATSIKRLHVQLQSLSSPDSDIDGEHSRFLLDLRSCESKAIIVRDPNDGLWVAPGADEDFVRQLYSSVDTEAELVFAAPLELAKMEAGLRTLLPAIPNLQLGADTVICSTEHPELAARSINVVTLSPHAY